MTIAEPDLQVLAQTVPHINNTVLLVTVGVGVGFFLCVCMIRILTGVRLRWLLIAFYAVVFILSVDFVGVEGVERLTDAEEDVVGDVDDVVYGVEADGFKGFLEPLRRILDGHALDEDAAVVRAGLWILDVDFYAGPVVVGGESVDRWA